MNYNPPPQQPPQGYGPPPPQQPPGYGPPPPPGYGPPPGQYGAMLPQGKAVASLVLGILSLVCIGILGGIPAVILGAMSIGACNRGQERGKGMATAGLVMGIISIAVTILWLAVFIPAMVAAGHTASPYGG